MPVVYSIIAGIFIVAIIIGLTLLIVSLSSKEHFTTDVPDNIINTNNDENGGYYGNKIQNMTDNVCNPRCCYNDNKSSLSCSSGCVCLPKAQQDILITRGGNRSAMDVF